MVVVGYGFKNGYQKDMYLKEIELRAQNVIIHSRLNGQHNWRDLYDYLMSTIIFTLILNKDIHVSSESYAESGYNGFNLDFCVVEISWSSKLSVATLSLKTLRCENDDVKLMNLIFKGSEFKDSKKPLSFFFCSITCSVGQNLEPWPWGEAKLQWTAAVLLGLRYALELPPDQVLQQVGILEEAAL
jgi:hypothetical protein